jgi:hypothetical protein
VIALDTIAAGLNRTGYELIRQSPINMEFERRDGKERIVISLEQNGSTETTMIVHGRASRAIRKQFARLTFD